jgi:acetyltransferase-like isoleucine patch superfamily enzyme
MARDLTLTDIARSCSRKARRALGGTNAYARAEIQTSRSVRGLLRQGRASVGRHSYVFAEVHTFDDSTQLEIGNFCSIALGVTFLLGGEHRTKWITTSPIRIQLQLPGAGSDGTPFSRGDIKIGNDVWIGHGAILTSGVTVGDGAVIGAGAVVLRDVADYAVVAGNPAKILRYRFDEDRRKQLQNLRWWDWPDAIISQHVDTLCSERLDELVESGSWRA